MKLTNKQIQQILAGVPDEFTHVDLDADDYEVYGGGTHNLSDLQEILELRQEVKRLRQELESSYVKWQAEYQQLKDRLTLARCHNCGVRVRELSPRNRCCVCEYSRAYFNENERNKLRGQVND